MPEIDLNLLRVFDALMDMRSVTRVADRLGLTQSAVSHALGRLRRALDDPLFVRGPQGLQPSARAAQIAPGVRASLQQVREALAPVAFAPATAEHGFTVAAGSYFCTLLIPPLLERVRRAAPRVRLQVVPLVDDGAAMLDGGAIDLAFGIEQDLPARFVVEPLFEDEMVWIAARTNPIAAAPDLARILRQPRVRVAASRPFPTSPTADHAAALALAPPIGWGGDPGGDALAIVYDSHTATNLVGRTDAVACVPRRIAAHERHREDIAILMPAPRSATLRLAMIWHGRNGADSALAWLRGLVATVADAGTA